MADHASPTAALSPKVTWPAATMSGAILLVAFLTGITPDMLSGLGAWSGPVFMTIGAAVGIITGYVKSDPLRNAESA